MQKPTIPSSFLLLPPSQHLLHPKLLSELTRSCKSIDPHKHIKALQSASPNNNTVFVPVLFSTLAVLDRHWACPPLGYVQTFAIFFQIPKSLQHRPTVLLFCNLQIAISSVDTVILLSLLDGSFFHWTIDTCFLRNMQAKNLLLDPTFQSSALIFADLSDDSSWLQTSSPEAVLKQLLAVDADTCFGRRTCAPDSIVP